VSGSTPSAGPSARVPDRFRRAGFEDLVRATVPLAHPSDDRRSAARVDERSVLSGFATALGRDRLVVEPTVGADQSAPGVAGSSHPPARRIERHGPDGAVRSAVKFRYPPRDRPADRLSPGDVCALGFVFRETGLSAAPTPSPAAETAARRDDPDLSVAVSADGPLLVADGRRLAAAREEHGRRLAGAADGRPLLAADPLAAAALDGYDPTLSVDHGDVYGVPAPHDLFRVEAHPKGWALAHQPEVARRHASRGDGE
jgi:hypothetical protein